MLFSIIARISLGKWSPDVWSSKSCCAGALLDMICYCKIFGWSGTVVLCSECCRLIQTSVSPDSLWELAAPRSSRNLESIEEASVYTSQVTRNCAVSPLPHSILQPLELSARLKHSNHDMMVAFNRRRLQEPRKWWSSGAVAKSKSDVSVKWRSMYCPGTARLQMIIDCVNGKLEGPLRQVRACVLLERDSSLWEPGILRQWTTSRSMAASIDLHGPMATVNDFAGSQIILPFSVNLTQNLTSILNFQSQQPTWCDRAV